MPTQKLTYTPHHTKANDHPNTMVLLVDEEAFDKYVAGDKTIPLAEVVDSFDVMKFTNPGREGTLGKPSKAELEAAFGTSKAEDIAEFMINNGSIHGKSNNKSKKGAAGGEPSRMEELLHADRRAY